jgi:guanylate kinase
VHGNRYGTSTLLIEERIAQGMDVMLEIDFQGAVQIKKICLPMRCLIFILSAQLGRVASLLKRRGEDSPR